MKLIDLSNRFKYARLYAGYSQREAAKAAGFMTPQALSHYEKGSRLPSNMILYTLPKLYEVSLDFLLNEDDFISHDDFVIEIIRLNRLSIKLLKAAKENHQSMDDLKEYIIQLKEELYNEHQGKEE